MMDPKTAAQQAPLPCPFCGSHDIKLTVYSGNAAIFCGNCEAMMGGEESTATMAELLVQWNRRVASQLLADAMAFARRMEETMNELAVITQSMDGKTP
jgi:Lar family restriction alleviation protein